MFKECKCNYVSKGTLTPLSDCCILVPSWTGNGIFGCNWNDDGETNKRKRQIEHNRKGIIQRRRTNLDKLLHEIRQCDVCARDILWTPSSLQKHCFNNEFPGAASLSQISISESLPRFIELHVPCRSPIPCSFCTMEGAILPWCGSLYCSKSCQIEAEVRVSTAASAVSRPNLPPPKLYFCRNRFGIHTNDDQFELVNEIRDSLLAIEKRLHSICGYDTSDLGATIQLFGSEECALLLMTMIACICPRWISEYLLSLSNDGVQNSAVAVEASLVEEFWAMSRTHRSIFNLLHKCDDGKDTTTTFSFPCYNDFLHCYLDIKRSCIVHVDASLHPLVAYATKTVTSSIELSESERGSAVDFLMPDIDLPTSSKLNDDPITRWRNAAHIAHWFSQSTSTDGFASRGFQIHLQKSYFAFSPNLFRDVRHSCVPTVTLTKTNYSLAWQALHNYQQEKITTSKLDSLEGSRQSRSSELMRLMGNDFVCSCDRCRYEAARSDDVICLGDDDSVCIKKSQFSRVQMKRLGDLAMQQGRFEDASKLYDSILLAHPQEGEVLHARAASYLGRASSVSFANQGHCQGYFTLAQRLWKEAGQGSPTHPDIAIQLKKQLVYKTLEYNDFAEVNIPYTSLLDGRCYVTKDPIISLEECQHVIDAAEEYAASRGSGGWTTSRHYAVPTTDLPLYELKELHTWFYNLWDRTIRPVLREQFKLTSGTSTTTGCQKRDVFLHDAFVVRYDSSRQRSLPPHYDESTLSFIVTLNKDFKGGGTFIHVLGKSIAPTPGGMLSFCGGDLLHSGDPVVKGERYIIAAFCYVDLYGDGASSYEYAVDGNRIDSNMKDHFIGQPFSFGFK